MTTSGRLAADLRGGSEPDREIRIGFGARRGAPRLAAFGAQSPWGLGFLRRQS